MRNKQKLSYVSSCTRCCESFVYVSFVVFTWRPRTNMCAAPRIYSPFLNIENAKLFQSNYMIYLPKIGMQIRRASAYGCAFNQPYIRIEFYKIFF